MLSLMHTRLHEFVKNVKEAFMDKEYVRDYISHTKRKLKDLDEEVYALQQHIDMFEDYLLGIEEEETYVDDLFKHYSMRSKYE